MSQKDPRRDLPSLAPEGSQPPEDARRITQTRKIAKRLEDAAPLPVLAPDASDVLRAIRESAACSRADAVAVLADNGDRFEALEIDIDKVQAELIKQSGQVDKVRADLERVTRTQVDQNSRAEELRDAVKKLEATWDSTFTGFETRTDRRLKLIEDRLDKFERRYQIEQHGPTTPKASEDATGLASGPPTVRPRKQ